MIHGTLSLGFGEAIQSATSKIFQFKGRARRSEYWWTQLLCWGIALILPIAGPLLSLLTIPLTFRRLHDVGKSGWWWGICVMLQIALVVAFCYDFLMIAVNSQNMDLSYQGNEEFWIKFVLEYWIYGLCLFIYNIILFIFTCLDSQKEENKYGPSPKYFDDNDPSGQNYTTTTTGCYDREGNRTY